MAKLTKKDYYNYLIQYLNGELNLENCSLNELKDFCYGEISKIDEKRTQAHNKAEEKKQEGNALKEEIYNILSESDFECVADINNRLGYPDVSNNQIIYRLNQLFQEERLEKKMIDNPHPEEGQRKRQIQGYKKISSVDSEN